MLKQDPAKVNLSERKPGLNQVLPQVYSCALAPSTPEMEVEVKAILKRVYAERSRTQL
jgi:hypothetical protein